MFKKRRQVPRTVYLMPILAVMVGLFFLVDSLLQPTLFTIAKAKAFHLATDIMNQTVHDNLTKQQLSYQDIINIHKDEKGKIVMVQADTIRINKISNEITLKVQQALRDINEQKIGIPLGQLFGFHLLAALGPEFNVRMIPVGVIRVDIIDKFEGAGINQTRHLIWLDLSSEFQIAIPLYKEVFIVNTKVPLAESIIVGDVPPALVTMRGGVIGN